MRANWVVAIAVVASTIAVGAVAAPEFAVPDREPFMRVGKITSQPIGHYEFCKRYTDECLVKSFRRSKAQVTEAGWAAIQQVNTEVNARIDAEGIEHHVSEETLAVFKRYIERNRE